MDICPFNWTYMYFLHKCGKPLSCIMIACSNAQLNLAGWNEGSHMDRYISNVR